MIWQKQSIQHDPDNGNYGDCYRTCFAIIMGLPNDVVPHFCDPSAKHQNKDGARVFLRERGFDLWTQFYLPEHSLDEILHATGHFNPTIPMIITGRSPRGEFNHCVVGLNGQIFCDPATGEQAYPEDALTGPAHGPNDEQFWWIEIITAMS